jgi:hypothetical protein
VVDELKDREWFLQFGETHTGQGTVPDEFEHEVILLTARFPAMTFLVYYFHWDCTCLSVYEIHDKEVKDVFSLGQEYVEILGGSIVIQMDPDFINIDDTTHKYACNRYILYIINQDHQLSDFRS